MPVVPTSLPDKSFNERKMSKMKSHKIHKEPLILDLGGGSFLHIKHIKTRTKKS
jgi:hypothetical protein